MINVRKATEEEKKHFQKFYKEHNITGILKEGSHKRIIVKMKRGYKGWTPWGTARDCGDHLIVARYKGYDRIDKKTLEITKNVEDK